MIRTFTLPLAALLCTSCVAVGVVVPSRDDVPLERYEDSVRGAPPDRAELKAMLAARGLVPEVKRDGDEETWWVEHSGRYCGFVFVVLPVVLPLCRSHDLYRFEGERLVSQSVGTTDFHGVVCSRFLDVGTEFEIDGEKRWCGIE